MSKTLWLLLAPAFLICLPQGKATGDSTSYLTLKDTIFLSIGPGSEKLFEHRIERKQTLFSLAKFYGLSVEELYMYNAGLKDNAIRIGQTIQIPIPNRAIIRYKDKTFKFWKHIPVYYVVRKGDTMFRICKVLFRMPIDSILVRNRLFTTDVQPGQRLQIGWMSIDGVPESFHQFTVDPITRRNYAMRQVYQGTSARETLGRQQGVAFWLADSKEDLDFYALHRLAPINSIIEVTNPMTGRIAYVKVVGKIPDRNYGDDVVVVLSPISAKALGAKDRRFFVRVTYPK